MSLAAKLTRAVLNNAHNPKLAWHLFRRILYSPTLSSTSCCRSAPVIARILTRAKMLEELDDFYKFILLRRPDTTRYPVLASIVSTLARSGMPDKAVYHFKSFRLQFPNRPPSIGLYNVLLQSCIKENCVDYVSWLYKDMLVVGVSPEAYTMNLLIGFFCDAGIVDQARLLFDKMPDKSCRPNEYSLGILIRGYCRAGLLVKGLELMREMRLSGCLPNTVVYNTLISSFCKCGRIDDAKKLVNLMKEDGLAPNVVSFNSSISALCAAGQIQEARRIFRDMTLDEDAGLPQPNGITHNLMLKGFCQKGMLGDANALVDTMKRRGNLMNLKSYNIWLQGLMRNGRLLQAQLALKEMIAMGIEPNIFSYNIIIDGLCKNGMLSDARTLSRSMAKAGIPPDEVTYNTLIHGYCTKRKVHEASGILHEMMSSHCFPSSYTCNILLQSLWKEGRISEAAKLLQKMNARDDMVDVVTCNIMVDGLCSSGQLDKAIEVVTAMWTHGSAALGNSFTSSLNRGHFRRNCTPDLVSYSTIIRRLCQAGRMEEAKKKFLEMTQRDVQADSAIYDIFILSYSKMGKVASAFRVLKDMEKSGFEKTLQTYNSLIIGLGSKNQLLEIYGLMDEMRERGISPNIITYNNLLSFLCESGRVGDAPPILDDMRLNGIFPNIFSFEMLIRAFCKSCDFGAALDMFEQARNICGEKEIFHSLMFNGLVAGGEGGKAKKLLEAAIDRSMNLGKFLYQGLIDRLCKDGKLEDASDILRKLINKGYQFDAASFIPVIDCLRGRGKKHEADELEERMSDMASRLGVEGRTHARTRNLITKKNNKDVGNDWKNIIRSDDGSRFALKAIKLVQNGQGHGNISTGSRKSCLYDS